MEEDSLTRTNHAAAGMDWREGFNVAKEVMNSCNEPRIELGHHPH